MSDPKDSSTLCPLPWLHRFVLPDGTIRACCKILGDSASRDDGRLWNITDGASEDEITNSEYFRKIKRQMMAGEWPDGCHRCSTLERLGGTSMRQQELSNGRYEGKFEDALARTQSDGTSPVEISYYSLQLGNICNLKCRMCNPFNSSRLISEYHLITGSPLPKEEIARYLSYTWPRTERSWSALIDQLPHVSHLQFAGAEPMIVPSMIEVLQTCVEKGEAHHITLTYNTNATRIPPEVRTLWPQFKGVAIACSIDGYGRLNDYIRYPSSWEEIHGNLLELDKNYDSYNCVTVVLAVTVQAYNVLGLCELFDYAANTFSRINPSPDIGNLLLEPPYFDIRVLPKELKQEAIGRLQQAKSRYADLWSDYLQHSVDAVINRLHEDMPGADQLIEEFIRVTSALDQHRKESLFSVVPELASAVGLPPPRQDFVEVGRVLRLGGEHDESRPLISSS